MTEPSDQRRVPYIEQRLGIAWQVAVPAVAVAIGLMIGAPKLWPLAWMHTLGTVPFVMLTVVWGISTLVVWFIATFLLAIIIGWVEEYFRASAS